MNTIQRYAILCSLTILPLLSGCGTVSKTARIIAAMRTTVFFMSVPPTFYKCAL